MNLLARATEEARAQTISVYLERYHGNVSAAARALGLDRCNLKRWMRRYGIQRPEVAR